MADPKPFSQYLAEAQAKRAAATNSSFGAVKPSDMKWEGSGGSSGDFWGTVLDIVTRPMNAVENVPNQIFNEMIKSEQEGPDYNFWGGVGNVATALPRGLFSNNPEDRTSGAELIEKGTDAFGGLNPNYDDTKDNVNPIVKGVGGFGIDVAADPLSYVPVIGWGAKGAGIANKLLRGGAKTAEEAAALSVAAANSLRKTDGAVAQAVSEEEAVKAFEDIFGEVADTSVAPRTHIPTVDEPIVNKIGAESIVDEAVTNSNKMTDAAAKAEAVMETKAPAVKPEDLSPTKIIQNLRGGGNKNPVGLAAGALQNIIKIAAERSASEAVAATKLTQKQWVEKAKQAVALLDDADPTKVNWAKQLANPENYAKLYKEYSDTFTEFDGNISVLMDVLDAPKRITNSQEWIAEQLRVDPEQGLIPYPRKELEGFGGGLMTPAEIDEVLKTGKLGGIDLTAKEIKKIKADAETLFEESGAVGTIANKVTPAQVLKELVNTKPELESTILGSSFSSYLQSLGESKFNSVAKMVAEIASGERTLDNIYDLDVAEMTPVRKLMTLLSGYDERLSDITLINAARRQAISNVNMAKRDEIIAAVAAGRPFEEVFVLSGFTTDEAAAVEKWFPSWLKERLEARGWEFRTDNDIARNSELMGEGKAQDLAELSTYDMWDLVQKSMANAVNEAKSMGLSGKARADFVRTKSMYELAIAESVIDQMGWPMWAGIRRAEDSVRYLVSPTQLMASMRLANPELLNKVMFNGSTAGPYTFMVDALVENIEDIAKGGVGITRERLAEILTGEAQAMRVAEYNKVFEAPTFNGFIDGGSYGFATKEVRKLTGETTVKYSGDDLIDEFYESMPKMTEQISKSEKANSEAFLARFGKEAGDLSEEALNDMEALFFDTARIGKAILYTDNIAQNIELKALESWALDISAIRATEEALGLTPVGIRSFASNAVKGTKAAQKASKTKGKGKAVSFQDAKIPAAEAGRVREEIKKAIGPYDMKTGIGAKLIDSGIDAKTFIQRMKRNSEGFAILAKRVTEARKRQKAMQGAPINTYKATDETADAAAIALWDDLMKKVNQLDNIEGARVETPKPAAKPKPAEKADKRTPAKEDADMEEAALPSTEETFRVADEQYQRVADETIDADPAFAKETPEAVAAGRTYGGIQAGVTAIMHPASDAWGAIGGAIASRLSRHYNVPHLSNIWHSLGGTVRQIRHVYTNELKQMSHLFGKTIGDTETTIMQQVYKDLQRGVVTKGYEEASKRMRALAAQVHDIAGDYPLLNDPFFRSGAGIKTINEYLKMSGIGDEFLIDIDKATSVAKAEGIDLWTAASQQWRDHKVTNPLNYLAQRHAALMKMSLHMSTAASFTRMAKANKMMWTGDVPPAGFVKAEGLDGSFFKFLPKDAYFDATIMKELQYLSDIADLSRSIDGRLGDIINKYIIPVQNNWKFAITLPRPGHHIRNGIGDATITYLAEGYKGYMKAHVDALRVMSLRNSYNDVDLFQALRQQGINEIPSQGDVLLKAKNQDITAGWVYDTMQKEGLLPTYHVGEDYVDDIVKPSAVSRFTDRLAFRNTKLEKVAGSVSEYRDHAARAQHFMQIIRKHANDPKFKNMDELVEYASKRVKKFHPDSTMLTAWEAKYMRLLIPFYSWFRGAAPALVEASLLNPGRALIFPKASYNLAVSMGVDPQSIYDPFPDDQMFPSFLTEQITGPQFKLFGNYFAVNPGIAQFDVGNQLMPDPLRGIAGMTSPLMRVPLELMSGGAWGTGARIKDPSDYVDASIPGVNYLSNISGISPTGSVASLLQGKGLDPQYQVSAGNKDAGDQLTSFINWMTGFGIQNYSKPNYINYAEIEKRNAAAKDQRSAY